MDQRRERIAIAVLCLDDEIPHHRSLYRGAEWRRHIL
jgi:hypothetical protein